MGQFENKMTVEETIDLLLLKANSLYLEIEGLYLSMQNDLSPTSVLNVMRNMGTLNALLQKAKILDNRISEYILSQKELEQSTTHLLMERQEILNRLYKDNQTLKTKADNMKSLLNHDIVSMSASQKAIRGYKPVETERRYIIQESF